MTVKVRNVIRDLLARTYNISLMKKTVAYGSARWSWGGGRGGDRVGLRRGKTGRVKVRQGMFPRNYAKLHPPAAL